MTSCWRFSGLTFGGMVVTLLGAGCSTAAQTPDELEQKSTAWLAAAADHPPGDPGRECIDSALSTGLALAALRSAGSSDDVFRDALLSGTNDELIRDQRTREYEVWQRTHDVNEVAANHLGWCLSGYSVALDDSGVLPPCFSVTEPLVLLSLSKHGGATRVKALQHASDAYKDVLPAAELSRYSVLIYAAPTEADELALRRRAFKNCLLRST